MKIHTTFYGLEQGFGISRLYRFYVTESSLCAAKISDRYYTDQAAAKEKAADALEPGSQQFLALDKTNFSLRSTEILEPHVVLERGNFAGTANRFGFLEFHIADGAKRRFFLLGEGNEQEVTDALKELLPTIQIMDSAAGPTKKKVIRSAPLWAGLLSGALVAGLMYSSRASLVMTLIFTFAASVITYYRVNNLVAPAPKKEAQLTEEGKQTIET